MSTALVLSKDVEKILKGKGVDNATILTLKTKGQAQGSKAALATFTEKAGVEMKEMKDEMKAIVASIPDQAFYGSLGTGLGVLLAVKGYAYAVEYFGPDSYAPDILAPAAGFVIAYGGATMMKDPPKKPGLNAPMRSFSIGLGTGLVAGSAWMTYDRRMAA